VGQGIIGIECREGDANVRALLQVLNDAPTRNRDGRRTRFRRSARRQLPVADRRLCEIRAGSAEADGWWPNPTAHGCCATPSRAGEDPRRLGEQLADRVLGAGAAALLERLRGG